MTPAARLVWVRMYERTGDAGVTCRRWVASVKLVENPGAGWRPSVMRRRLLQ